jgi:hypothetical protein
VFDSSPADELLVLFAIVLLIFEIYALGMVYQLRRMVDRRGGGYLLRIVFRFGVFVVISQSLTVTNALLRFADRNMTYDLRLGILLIAEIMLSITFLWTVWEIHHLPADRYADDPPVKRPEPCECICEQIDNAISPASAPVDQGDDHTPVAPV